jgi:phosphoglycolate phosphatase
MLRHVLFDLDGTLTDSADGITRCLRHAVERSGGVSPSLEALRGRIGAPLSDIFAEILGTDDAGRLADAISHYRERFDRVGFSENRLYTAIDEVVPALRTRGYKLYVATAKRQEDATRVIEHFRVSHWFERVFGVENEPERRDKTLLVRRILATCSLDARSVALVGDRSHDMQGARGCGVRALGAGWGYGSTEELQTSGAHAIAMTPDSLLAHLPAL